MLDSESQLREAIQKMRQPKSGSEFTETNGLPLPATNQEFTALSATTADSNVKYICPMPEHVSIEYEHPGKCPICGMTLVPVTQASLARLQPGGKLLYYTCPMPEHSEVRSEKPGKCPKCAMTLIPVMAAPTNSVTTGPRRPSANTPAQPEGQN
jgi:rubrerythrin